MQIVETLVFEAQDGLFEKLKEPLPLTAVATTSIPVYRLEIDPDLVIFVYVVKMGEITEEKFLQRLIPYLKSTIILSNDADFDSLEVPDFIKRYLDSFGEKAPVLLALFNEEDKKTLDADILSEHGLYLSQRSRLVFVNENQKDSLINAWKIVWGDLLKSG